MASRIHYDGQTVELSTDERQALSWLVYLPSAYNGPNLHHLRFALDRGGVLDAKARSSLSEDLRAAQGELTRPLQVWKRKYGSNVGLGSEAGFALLKRHRLRYLNHNVEPPAVYAAGRKAKGEVQTLGDVPELVSALTKLTAAAQAMTLHIEHDQAYEAF